MGFRSSVSPVKVKFQYFSWSPQQVCSSSQRVLTAAARWVHLLAGYKASVLTLSCLSLLPGPAPLPAPAHHHLLQLHAGPRQPGRPPPSRHHRGGHRGGRLLPWPRLQVSRVTLSLIISHVKLPTRKDSGSLKYLVGSLFIFHTSQIADTVLSNEPGHQLNVEI